MRRTGFKKPQIERKRSIPTPGTGRGVHAASSDVPVTVPKERPVRSEAYRRLVASLPCWHCGAEHRSQCAHEDMGKGERIKNSDTRTYPACGPTLGIVGCHHAIGTGGMYSKDNRRTLEHRAVMDTQDALRKKAQHDQHAAKVLRDVGLLP